MDSKLYNSNIATGSLARLICETLKVFIRNLSELECETIDTHFSDLSHSFLDVCHQTTKNEQQYKFINN